LPSNDSRVTHTQTDERDFMKYAAETGSGAMNYIPSFHKDWFRHSKINGGGKDSQIHAQHGDRLSPLSFLQNKESRLKTEQT
jgi:hypothetical protein